MRYFLIIILSFSLGINVLGQQTSSNKVEYVIYGILCRSLCFENCAQMYKLTDDTLLKSDSNSIRFFDDDFLVNGVFKGKPLSRKSYLTAKGIKDSIPNILYETESETFGHPDNLDQCGIFLEIKTQNKLKKFYIDSALGDIPEELRSYVHLIMNYCRY